MKYIELQYLHMIFLSDNKELTTENGKQWKNNILKQWTNLKLCENH